MADSDDIARIIAANRYLVIATAEGDGRPWVTPVFFAPLGRDELCWVSSPAARHSVTIASRPAVALTVFDSTVAVGQAEAAYFEAEATAASGTDADRGLDALNSRLPADKQLAADDLEPTGPLLVYRARIRRRYLLVRGGNPDHGNEVDITLEV